MCSLLCLPLAACKLTETIAVPTTIFVTVSGSNTTTAAKTTTVKTPALKSLSINLSIGTGQDYTAYVLPLFLTGDMVLHMSWEVLGGGFRMTVTTPAGQVVPVTSDGVQTSGDTELLNRSGGIVFCTSDAAYAGYDWGGDGYFNFTPNLIQGDAPVKVTLNYYLVNKSDSQ